MFHGIQHYLRNPATPKVFWIKAQGWNNPGFPAVIIETTPKGLRRFFFIIVIVIWIYGLFLAITIMNFTNLFIDGLRQVAAASNSSTSLGVAWLADSDIHSNDSSGIDSGISGLMTTLRRACGERKASSAAG